MAEIFRALEAKRAIPADGGRRPGFLFFFFCLPLFVILKSERSMCKRSLSNIGPEMLDYFSCPGGA